MKQRHRNGGLRKVCDCSRRAWAKCPHGWYLNYKVKGGEHYRLSIDRELGKHIQGKTEASNAAEDIRIAIRNGTFRKRTEQPPAPPAAVVPDAITLEAFGERFFERRGSAATVNEAGYLRRLAAFSSGGARLGGKALSAVTTDDLEAFFVSLKAVGKAASTTNKYRLFMIALFRWATKKGYLARDPLADCESITHHSVRWARRNRRLVPGEEQRLLAAAGPALKNMIIASLETGLRLGELLNLRWADISFQRSELTVRAETCKTRRSRDLPISPRLRGVLDMVRTDPTGADFKPDDYCFSDGIGRKVGSIKKAWTVAVLKANGHTPKWSTTGGLSPECRAHLKRINLHWHDLRHEAGSRFVESGWALHHVQHMLGHADLKQTSTYINVTKQGLHDSMRRFGTTPATVATALQTNPPQSIGSVATGDAAADAKLTVN